MADHRDGKMVEHRTCPACGYQESYDAPSLVQPISQLPPEVRGSEGVQCSNCKAKYVVDYIYYPRQNETRVLQRDAQTASSCDVCDACVLL